MRIETSLAVKEESSVRRVALLCIVLLLVLMFPCTERSAAASTGKTVGIDIAFEDITDFFYTYYDLTIRRMIIFFADKQGAHLDDKKSSWFSLANSGKDWKYSFIT
jgi:hypothetical protein